MIVIVFLVVGAMFYGMRKPGEIKNILQPQKHAVSSSLSSESKLVTKVIDGDTLVVEGGEHVRLLGIDADERGYPCYDAARVRLEELALNKTATLESDSTDKDQYGRLLRYIIVDGKDINETLVSEGLAVARFLGDNVKHKQEIVQAEKKAIDNHIGCKWSR